MLLISSIINTVLPTPAPPNKPILPPLAYGSSKSITLIPVNNTSVEVLKSSYLGGIRWIGAPPLLGTCPIPSMASPTTLNKRPFTCSPTGIVITAPVAVTSIPR